MLRVGGSLRPPSEAQVEEGAGSGQIFWNARHRVPQSSECSRSGANARNNGLPDLDSAHFVETAAVTGEVTATPICLFRGKTGTKARSARRHSPKMVESGKEGRIEETGQSRVQTKL